MLDGQPADWLSGRGGDQRAETWPGALALCLGVGNHGEAWQEMQGGRKVMDYLLPWLLSWEIAIRWLHPSTSSRLW